MAEARIGSNAAQFVFPAEPPGERTWDVPAPDAFTEAPEFGWWVFWDRVGPRGSVPSALTLTTYWRPGGPHRGTLAALLRAWRPSVETECAECQESVWIGQEDPAVVAQVEKGRVVMTIRGAGAVARIFPTVPDSVVLTRRRPDEGEEELTIAVQRGEP